MPRPKNQTPTYKRHKPTNTARCWFGGKWVSLGRFGSPESRIEHARIVALAACPEAPPALPVAVRVPADLTVAELLAAFFDHARTHYRRPDGTPTDEITNFRKSTKPLRELFDHTAAAEFGPLALKAVRQRMIDADICRAQINKSVIRIRHVFKWGASEQLVPVSVFQALATVAGIREGRSDAVESEPVGPVADAIVDATLPFLNRHTRGIVQFMRLTGCRPGEACALRWCDIDRTGNVWMFRPASHKTAHRGKRRAIAVGPKAQAVIEAFCPDDAAAYLFSPRRAVAEVRAERKRNRKKKLYASQIARDAAQRKGDPKRKPADRYRVAAIGFAVRKAAEKAGVPHWHPNQLRHTFATDARREFGIEAAGAALGHTKMSATEVYAERDSSLAVTVAEKVG